MMPSTMLGKTSQVDYHFLYLFFFCCCSFVVPVCHHCTCTKSQLIVVFVPSSFPVYCHHFLYSQCAVDFFHFLFSNSLLSPFMLLCCQHHCAYTKGTLLFPVTVICCSTCTMIKQLHCNSQLIVVFLFLKLPLMKLLL